MPRGRKFKFLTVDGYKTCSRCLNSKPVEDFYKVSKSNQRLKAACKSCVLASGKESLSRNPERRKEYIRKYRELNRDKLNQQQLVRTTIAREILAGRPRPQVCEVCGQEPKVFMHFDHDHKTGKFRAWLCDPCNLILGLAKDNPKTLRGLANLLESDQSGPKLSYTACGVLAGLSNQVLEGN